jgi:purine catabolism regulator
VTAGSYRDGAVITVSEVLHHVLPPGTAIAAGGEGLESPVTSVAALRARPASLGDLRGGEMVLLSTDALAALDPPPTLGGVVEALADSASALVVRGETTADARTRAGRRRLPLLVLPPGPPLTALVREIQAFLAERRTDWYQRRHVVVQELTALALAQRGLNAIAARMSALSACTVVFFDTEGALLGIALVESFPAGRDTMPDVLASLDRAAGHGTLEQEGRTLAWVRSPVTVRTDPAGEVVLVGEPERLDAYARLIVEAGATAAAIELAREHAVQETVERIQGDLISDLVRGTGNRDELAQRAARLGYDLSAQRAAITLGLDGGRGSSTPAAVHRRLVREPASPLLRSVPYDRIPAHLDGNRLTLFPEIEGDSARDGLTRVAEAMLRVAHAPRTGPAAGISRGHSGPDSFRTAYQEADLALRLGHALRPDSTVFHFADLGAYRLLLSVPPEAAREYKEEVLSGLAAHDREKNTALVPTLDAFLRAPNAAEAAARLNLHRNSLLYRLRRIRDITGLDLDDPETRFTLQLALRVGEILRIQNT